MKCFRCDSTEATPYVVTGSTEDKEAVLETLCKECGKAMRGRLETKLKQILADAFTTYKRAYRTNEGVEGQPVLHPRNKFPNLISYQAHMVIEYLEEYAEGKT